MNTNSESRILITKENEEGGFYIIPQGNGKTAMVDRSEDLPEWADNDNLASANLGEHREWYEKRIGEEGYSTMQRDTLQYQDLAWDAVDEEGDIVQIEPNVAWRMENLADVLGLEAFDDMEDATEISTKSSVTGEPSLADIQGTTDTAEEERQAING